MDQSGLSLDKGIYIDLDTIYDTRLTVIKALSKEVFNDMITDDYYDERLYDEFGFISNKLFNSFYKHRNNIILKHSYISKAVDLLGSEIELLTGKKIESGTSSALFVDINTYPYTLNSADENRIRNALSMYCLLDAVTINFIRASPLDIDMEYIGNRFGVVIMYSGSQWLDYQMSVKKLSYSDVKLYVPALLNKPVIFKKKEDLEKVFESRDTVLNPFMNITSLPLNMFNIKENFRAVVKDI